MSQSATLNAIVYTIPDVGDNNWGQNVTDYLVAIPNAVLQKTGGTFTLSAEVDFGSSFGLKTLYVKSRTANPASAGNIRFAKTDSLNFRNNANSADLALAINASDQLTFNGSILATSAFAINSGLNARIAIYNGAGTTLDDQATIGSGTVDITVASLASSRSYTIPDSGANSTFLMSDGTKTINGACTFTAAVNLTGGDLNVNNGASPNLYVTSTSGAQARILASGGSAVYFQTQSNHPLYMTTNNGATAIAIDTLQHVGIGPLTQANGMQLEVLRNAAASGPNSVGTGVSTGTIARFRANSNAVLDIGSNSSTNFWLQSTDQTSLAATYPIALNPNGGDVTVGTASAGDFYTVALTDYSGTSTVTGWSAFTTKIIRYKKIGKTMIVYFFIQGTSNATTASFTLPYADNSSVATYFPCSTLDNGTSPVAPALGSLTATSSTVNFSKDNSGAAFTGSGTKAVFGYFIYETA